MASLLPSTPEFEGHLSLEGWRRNLTASITPPGSDEEVKIPVKKLATGLLSFTNLLLEHQIDNNSYTKIHLKNPKDGTLTELYAETSKIQELISKSDVFPATFEEATSSSAASENPIDTFPTLGLSESIATTIKTNRLFFQLSDSIHMINSNRGSYIFHENKWQALIATPEKGMHVQALIYQQIAFKFLHTLNPKGEMDLKRSESILKRVNPHGLAIGIPKRPIAELALRNITTYSINSSDQVEILHQSSLVQLEEPFLIDCLDAINLNLIPKAEIPSIASCLIQGSINLIENGIYHLDVKLENIGYLGNGRAIHFDVGGSYDTTEENWEHYPPTYTSKYNIREEAVKALEDTSPESKQKELEKIHIFQLGITLFALATKTLPYTIGSDGCILPSSEEVIPETIKENLKRTDTYSESQITTITAMLSKNPDERPSLQEIQISFPLDLISRANSPT